MNLIIDNKKYKIKNCHTFFSRFIGLMFKKKYDEILVFEHCRSIHTFFMKFPIDIIFTTKDDIILDIKKNILPNKIIFGPKNAYKTYEMKSGLISKIEINIKLNII